MSKYVAMIGAVAMAAALTGCTKATDSTAAAADAASSSAKSGKASKGLALGDPAPAWEELEGIDGKKHSLAELEKAKAVVVVFTCNDCPVAEAYEERLVALEKDYAEKDVAVVAINVSKDELPAMKDRAEKQGFEFAYLSDPSQEIGRKFSAKSTPHAFVLDGERKVVYRGAIDDDMDAASASTHYVRDAVDDVLAGKDVRVAESKPAGCGIAYE